MPKTSFTESGLAIIGDADVVSGFKALGFKAYPAAKAKDDFKILLDEAVKDGAAVCLIQEHLYKENQVSLAEYGNAPLPIFIPFSKEERLDTLDDMIKNIRLRATGRF